MTLSNRPLSPHLQVYRPQITSVTSITHRATGIVLSLGALLLVYWLVAAATGPEAFADAQALIGSVFGRILLFGWTLALFYHFCNGIRHLFWDAGLGFELKTAYVSGWVVIVATVVLSLAVWWIGYAVRGA